MSIVSTQLLSTLQASAVTHSINDDIGFVYSQIYNEFEQNSCYFQYFKLRGGPHIDSV